MAKYFDIRSKDAYMKKILLVKNCITHHNIPFYFHTKFNHSFAVLKSKYKICQESNRVTENWESRI